MTNNGPNFIVGFSGAADNGLANKVFVHTTGAGYSMPTDAKLTFYREGTSRREFDIADSPDTGFGDTRLSFLFEVSGLTFADLDAQYFYSINFSSDITGEVMYPSVVVGKGDLTYAGVGQGKAGWVKTPGVAADWATQGNPAPYTSFALTELIDGPAGNGISIVNSSASPSGNFVLFRPDGPTSTFDLDDDANQVGVVNIETTLTFGTRGSNSIGFTTQQPVASLSTRDTDFVFARNLRALSAWTQSAKVGVEVMATPVDLGTTKLGDISIYLAKNSDNELGWYWAYTGASGSYNFAVSITMNADFEHNDRAAVANFLSLTDVNESTYSGHFNYDVVVGAGGGLVFTNPITLSAVRSSGFVNIVARRGLQTIASTSILPVSSSQNRAGLMTPQDKTKLDGIQSTTDFEITATPSTQVNVSTTSSGGWSAWTTIETTSAITSSQAGRVLVQAKFDGQLTSDSTGGGDRIAAEIRVIRTRSSVNTTVADEIHYIRNQSLSNAGGANSSEDFVDALNSLKNDLLVMDTAQAGDTYSFQARIVSQVNANVHTMQFGTSDNEIKIVNF